MNREDFEPTLPPEEHEALLLLVARLEHERPVPSAGFRGVLRRRLTAAPSRASSPGRRFHLWVVSYMSAGAACMAVAAIGLLGTGPFAA